MQTATCPISGETPQEEKINFLTHAFGTILAAIGMVVMVGYAHAHGDFWQTLSCSVYSISLVTVYGISSFYHRCSNLKQKILWKIADHSAIYFFIAGTYTPFSMSPCLGEWGTFLVGTVWTCAFLGTAWKIYFVNRFRVISTLSYLTMGWLVILALDPMLEYIPPTGMVWLIAGGALYSLGLFFYMWESLPYSHAVWHVFCFIGSTFHYCTIFVYIVPGGSCG